MSDAIMTCDIPPNRPHTPRANLTMYHLALQSSNITPRTCQEYMLKDKLQAHVSKPPILSICFVFRAIASKVCWAPG